MTNSLIKEQVTRVPRICRVFVFIFEGGNVADDMENIPNLERHTDKQKLQTSRVHAHVITNAYQVIVSH